MMSDENSSALDIKKRQPAPWEQAFLVMLSLLGNVTRAAESVNISRQAIYKLKNDPRAKDFARGFDEAMEMYIDRVEGELHDRVFTGAMEDVYYQGQVVGQRARKSDILLMFLLKALNPEKYREDYIPPPIVQNFHNIEQIEAAIIDIWGDLEGDEISLEELDEGTIIFQIPEKTG